MTYKILNTKTIDETLFTEVEYDFDGKIIVVDIPHFMPKSSQEVINNILNRASTEQIKINYIESLQNVINELPINQIQDL
jgi:hypothetical protein